MLAEGYTARPTGQAALVRPTRVRPRSRRIVPPPRFRVKWRRREFARTAEGTPLSLSSEPVPPQRILVVDGYVEAAQEMAGQLRKMGHTVEFALDGPTALRLEPTFKPDIVIIRLDLPGMDAITLARSLRVQANRDVMLVGDRGSAEDYARRPSRLFRRLHPLAQEHDFY